MRTRNCLLFPAIAVLASLTLVAPARAQPLVRVDGPGIPLERRWHLAHEQAGEGATGYWIGYSIDRLMEAGWYIGWGRSHDGPTLYERLYGSPPPSYDRDARLDPGGDIVVRVRKEIAVLFYLEPGASEPAEVRVSDVALAVGLDDGPLYWLGRIEPEESLAFTVARYTEAGSAEVREDLVTYIGLHDDVPETTAVLGRILQSAATDDVRERAVFALGRQPAAAAFDLLLDAAENDPAPSVREHAVMALSHREGDAATTALIAFARRTDAPELRKHAIQGLGHRASRRVDEVLTGIVNDDRTEMEVKKHAVYAIAQLDEDRAVPLLVDLALNHPNGSVRKHAVLMLGNTDDPRAVETLVRILQAPAEGR